MKQGVVYYILNNINNKIYIGSTGNYSTRKTTHLKKLRENCHVNKHLQSAWNKYGEKEFSFNILEYVSDLKLLLKREQVWLDFFKPEYNICRIAGSMLGIKHRPEANQAKSLRMKGKKQPWQTEEYKRELSRKRTGQGNPNFGIPITEKHREIVRNANKNKVISPSHKLILARTMRETMKGREAHNKGKRRIIDPVTGKQSYLLKI